MGSESSGHSSRLPSFDHRRSFVPSFSGRSLSVNAPASGQNQGTKRLNQQNVDTIKEDEETPNNTDALKKTPSLKTPAKSVPAAVENLTEKKENNSNNNNNNNNNNNKDNTDSGKESKENNNSNSNNNNDINSSSKVRKDSREITDTMYDTDETKMADSAAAASGSGSARNSLTSAQLVAEASSHQAKIAEMIDYASIRIDVRQTCKCGYILSDAHVMAGWANRIDSEEVTCVVCHEHRFVPQMRVMYDSTKMSIEKEIYHLKKEDFKIPYYSPLILRKHVSSIISNHRRDLEDSDTFRTKHRDAFWNLLWYLYNRDLDLTFLVGDNDKQSVKVSISAINEEETKYPLSDRELYEKLSIIVKLANAGKLKDAIGEWINQRSNTDVNERENSVWNLPIFDAFTVLEIPLKYKNETEFVQKFKKACYSVRPVLFSQHICLFVVFVCFVCLFCLFVLFVCLVYRICELIYLYLYLNFFEKKQQLHNLENARSCTK